MNLANQPIRSYSKADQLYKVRIKPTQRQMGDISPKVRKEVRIRSGGICEVRERCNSAPAVQQAHVVGRKQLKHKTTAEDLLDSCLACHKWLDETVEGIKYKRSYTASQA